MADSNDSDLTKDIGNEAFQLAKDIPVLGNLLKWGDAFAQVRGKHAARNLTEFFRLIARGEDVTNDPRFWDKVAKEFEVSDFANLAEAVAREDEEEKIPVYANIYCAFVDNRFPDAEIRRQIILAARELTRKEIDLARSVYDVWAVCPHKSKDEITAMTKKVYDEVLAPYDRSNVGYVTLQKMERLGFIRKKGGYDPSDYHIPAFTPFFVEAAFTVDG